MSAKAVRGCRHHLAHILWKCLSKAAKATERILPWGTYPMPSSLGM